MLDRPPLPFPDSLCHGCRHLRLVGGKRSVFLQCRHPDLPRYARQPVLSCAAMVPAADAPG
jgi:hypothetical protein